MRALAIGLVIGLLSGCTNAHRSESARESRAKTANRRDDEKPAELAKTSEKAPSSSGANDAPAAEAVAPQVRELGRQGAQFFIYVNIADRGWLNTVVRQYRARYPKRSHLLLQFYDDFDDGARKVPMSDASMECWLATYVYNKTTGMDRLTVHK